MYLQETGYGLDSCDLGQRPVLTSFEYDTESAGPITEEFLDYLSYY
jgi:hypothetical protein